MPSWSPGTARQHPREFDTNNTHTIMFDPDYNMMPPFFYSNQYSLIFIKRNLKFESRATAVYVAMSPRYLGGKYRSRLHSRSRKCACQFLWETERVKSNCARPAPDTPHDQRWSCGVCWSCGVFKSWIADAHRPFQWKWQVLHNYNISVLQRVGTFFDGIACLMNI